MSHRQVSLNSFAYYVNFFQLINKKKSHEVTAFTDIECGEIHIGIIIVPALATLTLVLGLVYAYYFGMHSKTKESRNNKFYKFPHNLSSAVNGNKRNLERTFDSMGMPAILESEKKSLPMPKDRFEIRPDQLKIKDILRSGASGIIRHGCYKISKNLAIDVAVKTIKGMFGDNSYAVQPSLKYI